MISLAKDGYTQKEVEDMLHYAYGSRQAWISIDLLNKYDVQIGALDAMLETGNVKFDASAEIKRVANITVKEKQFREIDWLNDRIRPMFNLKTPKGDILSWSLGVFLISSPSRRHNNYIERDLELYDKSLILREDKITDRLLLKQGTPYLTHIVSLLNSASINQVDIEQTELTLTTDKEYEIGTSKLKIINELLAEMNYKSIWVDENGIFTSNAFRMQSSLDVEYEYRTDKLSIIKGDAVEEADIFNAPNKWVRYVSNPELPTLISKYENNSLSSITSIPNRGRIIVDSRSIDDIADQATLDKYIQRVAYEASQVYSTLVFNTAIMPHHSMQNLLFISYDELGIHDKYVEESWNISFTGTMTHNAKRVIFI